MAEYLPKFKPGEAFTVLASGTVTGGQLLAADGAVCGANETGWLGVASHDATTGQKVGVYREAVQYVVANGAVAVKGLVKCAAAGKVAPHVSGTDAPERLVGVALTAAAADGDVIAVAFAR